MKVNNQKKNWNTDDLFSNDIDLTQKEEEEEEANEDYQQLLSDCEGKSFLEFNEIIGLPQKNDVECPIFDYELDVIGKLEKNKHIWILKATGLGISELMLRYIAWLCLKDDNLKNSQICIVTGPRIDLAIDLMRRLKGLFYEKGITFTDKETVLELNGVRIEAYPSHHLDSMRGLPNVSFIYLDEADFFPPGQQEDARKVSERYIAKSNPYIVMVSTPNKPNGLFESIEREEQSIYDRVKLDYTIGLDKIYTRQEIEEQKKSPNFEQEYNIKYLGGIGNFFDLSSIEACIAESEVYDPDIPNREAITIMGIDTGWASSYFAIVIVSWFNQKIYVMHASQILRPRMNEMVDKILELRTKYMVDKICVDGSDPNFIYMMREKLGEWPIDYHTVDKEQYRNFICEPVSFTKQQYEFLVHDKEIIADKGLRIHSKFQDLIIALKSAYMEDTRFDKERSTNNDLLDGLSMALSKFHTKTVNTVGSY